MQVISREPEMIYRWSSGRRLTIALVHIPYAEYILSRLRAVPIKFVPTSNCGYLWSWNARKGMEKQPEDY